MQKKLKTEQKQENPHQDLIQARENTKNDEVVFIRIEQLYPFPAKTLANLLKKYIKKYKITRFVDVGANIGVYALTIAKNVPCLTFVNKVCKNIASMIINCPVIKYNSQTL